MKHILTLKLIVLFLFAHNAVGDEKQEDALKLVWSITKGLKSPESVYYDAKSGFLFLSQIGEGGGAAKDGDGWITKLNLEGQIVENKWVTGLDAPKGIRSHGNTLWVSDIDCVVAIDITEGKVTKKIEVPGAKFLNDLATGPDGSVYVSDLVTSQIIKITDDEPSVFLEGEQLQHPNGVLVHHGHLIVGGWGTGFDPTNFTTKVDGRLLKVNLTTKKQTAITPKPTGHLDGIEVDGRGGYLVTDWFTGNLFQINKAGESKVIQKFPRGLADHAYLVKERLLIVPEMMKGKLTAYRFAP